MADKIQLEAIVDYIVKAGEIKNPAETQREFDKLTAALAKQLKVKPIGLDVDVDPELKLTSQQLSGFKRQVKNLNDNLAKAFLSGDANDGAIAKQLNKRYGQMTSQQVLSLKRFLDSVLSAYDTPATRQFSKKHSEVLSKVLGGTSVLDLSDYERRLAKEAAALQKAQAKVLRKVLRSFRSVVSQPGAANAPSAFLRLQDLLLPQLEASLRESDKAARRLDRLLDVRQAADAKRREDLRIKQGTNRLEVSAAKTVEREAEAERKRKEAEALRIRKGTNRIEVSAARQEERDARVLANQAAAERRQFARQRVKEQQAERRRQEAEELRIRRGINQLELRAAAQQQREAERLERQQAVAAERRAKLKALAAQRLRGRAAIESVGGSAGVLGLAKHQYEDALVYLRTEQQRMQRRIAASDAGTGPRLSTKEIEQLNTKYADFQAAIKTVNAELRGNIGFLHQAGLALRAFLRYAIGYAALYKVVDGIRALAAASINLEDQLKQIQAITGSTNEQMGSLSEVIKETAKSTRFGLQDISAAVKLVAQAGVDLKDIPKTVQAVANLATAAGASLETAADVITTVKSVWDNLDATTIADQVKQAANVSKLAVDDLRTILSLGSSAARQANLTLEQFLGTAATLRNAGVRSSTIATGTSQLLAELFSPDKKAIEFLKRQYRKIGEELSDELIFNRFAGFRFENNPILSALTELKRIGADSVEAQAQFRRVFDERAFRAIIPLLRNLDRLPELSAQITTGPTSFEAAQVAMDGFKASVENLGNSLEALADTLSADLLPGLTDQVKSLTTVVERFEDALTRLGSAEIRERIATVATSAISGAVIGAARGRTPIGRAAGAVVGGLTGTAIGAGTEFSDTGQAAQSRLGEVGTVAAEFGLVALLSKLPAALKRLPGLVRGNPIKAAEGAVSASSTFLSKLAAPFQAIATRLPILAKAGSLLRFNGYALALTGAFYAIEALVEKFIGKQSDTDQLRDLQRRLARDEQKRAEKQAALGTFRLSEPGRPAQAGGQAAQFEQTRAALKRLSTLMGQATGALISDEFAAFDAALKIVREGASAGPAREQLKRDLLGQFNGTNKAVDDALLKDATDAALELNGAIEAIGKNFGDTVRNLVVQVSERGVESLTEQQRSQVEAITQVFQQFPDTYNKLLNNLPVQRDELLKAYELFLNRLQAGVKSTDVTLSQLAERLKSFADIVQKSGNLSSLLALQGEIGKAVQTLGTSAVNLVEETIKIIDASGKLTAQQVANLKAVKEQALNTYLEEKRTRVGGFTNDLQGFLQQTSSDPRFRRFVETSPGGKALLEQAEGRSKALGAATTGAGLGVTPLAQAKAFEALEKLVDPNTAQAIGRLRDVYAQQNATLPEKEAKAKLVPYGPSADALRREAEIQRLNLDIERLKDTNFSLLGQPGPDNPLIKRLALEIQNVEEEFADKIRQAPTDAHKAAYGQQLKGKVQELEFNVQKQIEDFARSSTQKRAQQEEKVLERQIKDVEASIKVAEDTGDTEALTGLLARQSELYAKLREVRETVLSSSVKDADIAAIRSDVNNQIGPRQIQRRAFESRLDASESAIQQRQKGVEYLEQLPADLDPQAEGRRRVRGEDAPLSDRIAQLQTLLEQQRELLGTARDQVSAQAKLVEEARVAFGEKSPEYQKQVQGLRDIATKANEAAVGLGEVNEQLNKLAPTLENELKSVSLDNLANGIQHLDGSLANLGINVQDTLVGAIGDLTRLTAEFIVNGFKAKDSLGEVESALQRVADAEARYYQLQQSRIGLLKAIDESAIAKEDDPYVRSQIIDAATAGQRGLEDLARQDIQSAKEERDQAEERNSLFGQMRAIIQQAAQTISTSIIQALLLEKVKDAFGGRGTLANPMIVKQHPSDTFGASAGGGAPGLLGGASDLAAKGLGMLPGLADFAKGGSGLGSFFSNLLMSFGFARGGYVSGPGTSTSDSIPARLSAGEYVLNAKAVKHIGKGTLDRLNGLQPLRFANGGYVPAINLPKTDQVKTAGAVASTGTNTYNPTNQGSASIRIVNTIDPNLVHDYLSSSAGERVIVNHIQRNAGKIRQMVK